MKSMMKLLRLFPVFGVLVVTLVFSAGMAMANGDQLEAQGNPTASPGNLQPSGNFGTNVPLKAKDCRDQKGVPVSGVLGSALGVGDNCIGNSGINPIFELVGIFIRFFGTIFGLILVGMLVYAGFLYVTSDGSPDATKEAKDRIKGVVTGIILFTLMMAILQFVLPGDQKIFR
jgi:hypothetical protein